MMNRSRKFRRAAIVAVGLVFCAGARAQEARIAPRVGATLKGDVVNAVGVAGIKAWLLEPFVVECDYVGVGGDFTGYAIRGHFLIPAEWLGGMASIQPYIGAGYASIRQDLEVSGRSLSLGTDSIAWGVAGDGTIECEGSGLVISCGAQANPFKAFPRLFLEAELIYALFDVEGQGQAGVQGTGSLAPYSAAAEVTVESDYDALSFLLGLSVYF